MSRRGFAHSIEVDLAVSDDTCGKESKVQYLEHVVVILQASFARRGYLEGFVTSPSGTTSQILPYRVNDVIARDFNDWPILSLHFWGEDPRGTWRLRLQSRYPNYRFSGENHFADAVKHRIQSLGVMTMRVNESSDSLGAHGSG